MKQTKTLAQVANDIENGNNLHEYNNNETVIKTGSFDSFGDFMSYFDMHYRPMLERIENGDEISEKDRHLLNFLASDLLAAFNTEDSEDEGDEDEDPTLTDEEKRDTLCRLWDKAWAEAKADPEGTRVIVETNEGCEQARAVESSLSDSRAEAGSTEGQQDPTAGDNEFGRYYMIDGSEQESCIDHAGQWVVIRVDTVKSPYEVRRPNWHHLNGYADDWTQLFCKCENPNNVTRWARLMIDAGRVTDIYADSY